jgi:hypothetical protein
MTNISTKNKIVYFNICILIHIRQMLWVRTLHRCSVLDTTLCDKVCQWLASGLWFSPGTPVSCNNKTDITEILLKVASACIAHLVIHISVVESGLSLHCSLGYSHFYCWKWPQPALLTWLFTFLLLKVASACIAYLVIHISIVESGLSLHCSLGYSHFYC